MMLAASNNGGMGLLIFDDNRRMREAFLYGYCL